MTRLFREVLLRGNTLPLLPLEIAASAVLHDNIDVLLVLPEVLVRHDIHTSQEPHIQHHRKKKLLL